jgi:CheY-like chemotaxis protein
MMNAAKPILIIDAPRSMDQADLWALFLRGYRVTTTETAREALELIHQAEFDCILINVAASASGDYGGLTEIRQFVRSAPVALMTAAPLESLIREALEDGSIELFSVRVLSTKIEHLSQPALLVGTRLPPGLIEAIRSRGLLFSCGTTLQFAMNLLVDGWCQIVFLAADIAGITETDELAIFHQVKAKQLAILASALPDTPSAIIAIEKPRKAEDYIALFEQIAGHRTGAGGLEQGLGKPYRDNP